jgi:LysR family transcriptional regulator, cyn operon transcriptional activator
MDTNGLELRHLRYFVATLEAHNFTRAARQLNISQPALSHSISQLEERLGSKLFERSVSGIRLTPAGRVFEKTAYKILREIGAATQLVAESIGTIAGEIRLGFVKSVNVCWVPQMIGRFLRKYPQVKFSVESVDIADLESKLLAEKLDLGVGFLEESRQSLRTVELFSENLVLIANPKCQIPRLRSVDLNEIKRFPLVLLRRGFCTRELIEQDLANTGVELNVLAEFDSIEAIVSCVQAIPAISVLPAHSCDWRAHPEIHVIPLSGHRWKRSVGLIIPRTADELPAIRCFVDFLQAHRPSVRPLPRKNGLLADPIHAPHAELTRGTAPDDGRGSIGGPC